MKSSRISRIFPAVFAGHHRYRGFTAVEVAMVATVIAIIALLALPLFRKRAEEAREAAVYDELSSLAKMQLLSEADIGFQVRLQDLLKPEIDPSLANITIKTWDGEVINTQTLLNNWKGPYLGISTRNSVPVADLSTFWYNPSDGNGFIYVINSDPLAARNAGPTEAEDNIFEDLYPIDPWGNPYVFFGEGNLNISQPGETNFNTSIIVSFGPDGVTGNAGDINSNPNAYRRFDAVGTGVIGDPQFDAQSVDENGDFVYRF
ncbi:MAG: hypothetical protein ACFCU1_12965 [Sumerlaeia bacterium]